MDIDVKIVSSAVITLPGRTDSFFITNNPWTG